MHKAVKATGQSRAGPAAPHAQGQSGVAPGPTKHRSQPLHRRFALGPASTPASAPANAPANTAANGPAQQLPGNLRGALETYFKVPLGHVRLHSGVGSQAAAQRLGAAAFTLGHDIHLGPAGLRSSGSERSALLAHEVVHTLQQGPATPRAKAVVGRAGDAHERQADQLADGFNRFIRNPHDAQALQLRNAARVQRLGGSAPTVQCSRVATHFGEFEDFQYQDMTNAAGAAVGVEMYMKFHPGTEVRADLIGMTQAAEGKFNGTQVRDDLRGEHSAATGAGTGSFIDQLDNNANPLYATDTGLKAGGSAANLADYTTTAVTPLTAAQQTAQATSSGITGRRYTGWGQHGFRKVVSGAFVTQDAELYDAPVLSTAGANSEQVFETTALAIDGPQRGTYYGSVQWGWRKDAAGAFTRLPLTVVSQGVPLAGFLTAASIWNPSKASFGLVATVATDLLNVRLARLSSVPLDAELVPTGTQGRQGGNTYIEVTFGGATGFVISTAVRAAAIGTATVDLPVPMVQTVTNPLGTTMILHTPIVLPTPGGPQINTLNLPAGTRVTTTRCMAPTAALPNHEEGEVVDGPNTGARGYFSSPDLAVEALGRH